MEEYQNAGIESYENFDNSIDDKSRKVKTIVVASIAAVIVLIAAIWGIISIVGSVNNKKSNNTDDNTVVATEDANTPAGAQGEISPADQYTAETKPATDAPVISNVEPVAAVSNTPETGPTDLALTALLMGITTSLLLVNVNLKKQEA